MCAATRAGLLPVGRREQQAPTSSDGKPSGLPFVGRVWDLTRSLYGYSMSNRIKSNPLARGPDPRVPLNQSIRFVRAWQLAPKAALRPAAHLSVSTEDHCASWPLASPRISQIGLWFAGARFSVLSKTRVLWPVDLRQLVLSLLLRTPHRASVVLSSPLFDSRQKGKRECGGRQLPG
jgi:hypothetical protein